MTGALGFIGRALSQRLRDEGAEVGGVDVRAEPELGVVAGDVTEPGAWQEGMRGCDVVFHTAAIVSNAVDMDGQWKVNVLGTRRAVEGAAAGGAGRFVTLSSVRAFSDNGFPDGVDESWPVRPDGNPYVDTKIASEQVVLQAHAAGEVECTVIRPGDVYGPRSRPWTILPVEAIRAGRLILPAGGRGVFSPVYVDNLVDGLLLAASKPEGAGEVFTVSDGVGITCAEFFAHYARMLGKPDPRGLPTPVVLALVGAIGGVERLREGTTEMNAATVRYLARTGTYSIAKARERLGFDPQVGLDEGMRRTQEWLRQEGMLDSPAQAGP